MREAKIAFIGTQSYLLIASSNPYNRIYIYPVYNNNNNNNGLFLLGMVIFVMRNEKNESKNDNEGVHFNEIEIIMNQTCICT